jgi:hypothetical protein
VGEQGDVDTLDIDVVVFGTQIGEPAGRGGNAELGVHPNRDESLRVRQRCDVGLVPVQVDVEAELSSESPRATDPVIRTFRRSLDATTPAIRSAQAMASLRSTTTS